MSMTTAIKYFTPEDARKTLPLVKKIVKDILDTTREMRLLAEEIGGNLEDDSRIKKMAGEVNHFLNELEEIGCYYKDANFTIGIVDFPSVINNEDVFLCWRSDEEDILFYHDMKTGYAGRKPIPPQYFSQN